MRQHTIRKLAAASASLGLLGWFALRSRNTEANVERRPRRQDNLPPRPTPTPQGDTVQIPTWADRVIQRVSRHEGNYWSQNKNRDRCGLSFGIIQWAQCVGNLGKLLLAMKQDAPVQFATTFGPHWQELLTVTNATGGEAQRIRPVGGVKLWQEPWSTRFDTAGRHPTWQHTQRQLAFQGHHFELAMELASTLGVDTERGMAIMYDRAVQQSPKALRSIAAKTNRQLENAKTTSFERAKHFARNCALNFWRKAGPRPNDWSSRLVWKPASDGSWHMWSGSFDLYEGISKRNRNITGDGMLTDNRVLDTPGQALV